MYPTTKQFLSWHTQVCQEKLMAALVGIAKALETTQMSINSRMDKLSNLIQCNITQQKNEFTTATHFNFKNEFQKQNIGIKKEEGKKSQMNI